VTGVAASVRVAQLRQGALLDLPDALDADREPFADLRGAPATSSSTSSNASAETGSSSRSPSDPLSLSVRSLATEEEPEAEPEVLAWLTSSA
jgi:hypothetical protein